MNDDEKNAAEAAAKEAADKAAAEQAQADADAKAKAEAEAAAKQAEDAGGEGGEGPKDAGELDAAALRAELERTRREAAKYRTKAKEAEEEAEKRRLAEMTELEQAQERAKKLEAERDAAEQARRETAAEAQILAAAKDFNDPSDAVAFLASQVEFDEDGKPTNVAELVKGLADSKPHLVTPAPGAHGGNPARPGGGQQPDTKHERYARVMGGSAAKPPWMS